MRFDGFAGNDAVKRRLSGAFSAGRVGHGYLLCGPDGSGKHTLARILAAAMQCTGRDVPCGVCEGCRKAFAGVHPDIITVDDPDHRSMTVDPIRAARSDMFIRPNEGIRKVYIIPRGQDMNENAQNALLKILEEPPDYGAFLILSTDAGRLLPTVRSRCAELRLGPVPADEALPILRRRCTGVCDDDLRAALTRAGGLIGQAIEALTAEPDPFAAQFAAAYAARDRMALLRVLVPLEKQKREQLTAELSALRACLCEALGARSGFPAGQIARQLAAVRTGAELLQAAQDLQSAVDALAANAAPGAVAGWLAMKLH